MDKCTVRGCSYDVYKHANDSRCIYHTLTGKTDVSTRYRIRERLYGREVISNREVVEEFVRAFNILLEQVKGSKIDLNCEGFVFPRVQPDMWMKMWQPLLRMNEHHKSIIVFEFPVSFEKATFNCDIDFDNAMFKDSVSFNKVTFNGSVIFNDVRFSDSVQFIGAKFNKEVNCWDTEFNKNASFAGVTFKESVYFFRAQFLGSAAFDRAIFGKSCYFEDAIFKKNVMFIASQFNGLANFVMVKFNKNFMIKGSSFRGSVYFNNTKFGHTSNFSRVTFEDKASFKGITIFHKGIFTSVKFHKDVDFSEATIQLLDLSKCEIFSFLRLREIKNHGRPSVVPIILLRDLIFWENGHLILEDINLTNTSFWQTIANIIHPRITFIRSIWGKDKAMLDDPDRKEYQEWKAGKLSNTIWDEIYEIVDESPSKVEEIERCYRQIRLTYEANGEYPDAGDFYRKEMNARKKRLKGLLKILHFLYGLISKYGESISCTIFWFGVFWLIFATLFGFSGFEKSGDIYRLLPIFNWGYFGKTLTVLVDSGIAVLNAVTLGRMDSYKSINTFGAAVLVVSRIILISVLTLMLLAIRRRFRR